MFTTKNIMLAYASQFLIHCRFTFFSLAFLIFTLLCYIVVNTRLFILLLNPLWVRIVLQAWFAQDI